VKSPFDVLSDETLHQFIPMSLQIASQGLDDQAVDIWKPSCLYLFLGLFGQAWGQGYRRLYFGHTIVFDVLLVEILDGF